jgi:hypothetical protein
MVCPSCGAHTDPAQPYCLNCGVELYPGGGGGYNDPWQGHQASAPPASSPPGAWGQPGWDDQGAAYQHAGAGYQQGYYDQAGAGYEQPAGYDQGFGGYAQGGYDEAGAYQAYDRGYQEPPPPRGRYHDDQYEEYDDEYDDEERGARWPSWLLAGVLVVILVLGGLYVAKRTGFIGGGQATGNSTSTSPPPDDPTSSASADPSTSASPDAGTAKDQATAIDTLLTASSKSRKALSPALSSVSGCSGVDNAVSVIDQVTSERSSQVDQAKALAVSKLPDGKALQDKLVQMLTDSLHADQAYGQWAKAVQSNGCGSGTSFRNQGDSISGSAQANKGAFLAQWNPIATANGLSTRDKSEI